jgi:hypothetical protein
MACSGLSAESRKLPGGRLADCLFFVKLLVRMWLCCLCYLRPNTVLRGDWLVWGVIGIA